MASITHLLDEMAASGILTRTELAWRARHLAPELSPGKRGKAGTATSRDAARLLMAAMTTAPATKLSQAVRRIANTKTWSEVKVPIALAVGRDPITIDLADVGSSFEKALISVIDLRRNPDVHTADKAANISKIGIREAQGGEWPWIEIRDFDNKEMHDFAAKWATDARNLRFVFREEDEDLGLTYFKSWGQVRETAIDAAALYRVSAALGLEWATTNAEGIHHAT
jgi:hypothetical protein